MKNLVKGTSDEDVYELKNFIGKGEFGEVYQALDRNGKTVAIKRIEKGKIVQRGLRQRVEEEARIHIRLKHENVVPLLDFYEDSQYVYFVMEYCSVDLDKYLKELGHKGKRLDENTVKCFLKQVLDGLQFLHKHQIMHRDLKPTNILLTSDCKLKIADFGLATMLDSPDDKHKTFVGTPTCLAPEIARGSGYGPEVDIWSLGVILYRMLAGEMPFNGRDWKDTIQMAQRNECHIPEYLSPAAANLIQQLLQKDPKKRIKLQDIPYHGFMMKDTSRPDYPALKGSPEYASLDSGRDTMTTMSSTNFRGYAAPQGPNLSSTAPAFPTVPEVERDRQTGMVQSHARNGSFDSGTSCRPEEGDWTGGQPPPLVNGYQVQQPYQIQHTSQGPSMSHVHPSPHSSHHHHAPVGPAQGTDVRWTAAGFSSRKRTSSVPKEPPPHGTHSAQAVNNFHNFPASQHVENYHHRERFTSHDGEAHGYYQTVPDSFNGGPLQDTQQLSRTVLGNVRLNQQTSSPTSACPPLPTHPPPPCLPKERHPRVYNASSYQSVHMSTPVPAPKPAPESHHPGLPHREVIPRVQCPSREDSPISLPSSGSDKISLDMSSNSKASTNSVQSRNNKVFQQLMQTKGLEMSCDFGPNSLGHNTSANTAELGVVSPRSEGNIKAAAVNMQRSHSIQNLAQQKERQEPGMTRAKSMRYVNIDFESTNEQAQQGQGATSSKPCPKPLNTTRIRNIRHDDGKCLVMDIIDGWVYMEFPKVRKTGRRTMDVMKISPDGKQIQIYKPNGTKGVPTANVPPPHQPTSHLKEYSLETLPRDLHRKYQYASRFVDLVKSKTPKVILYTPQAKGHLMEDSPTPLFEATFYNADGMDDGRKVTITKSNTRLIAQDGSSMTLDSSTSSLHLSPDLKEMYEYAECCRQVCLAYERLHESQESLSILKKLNSDTLDIFPITYGRRPTPCNTQPPDTPSSGRGETARSIVAEPTRPGHIPVAVYSPSSVGQPSHISMQSLSETLPTVTQQPGLTRGGNRVRPQSAKPSSSSRSRRASGRPMSASGSRTPSSQAPSYPIFKFQLFNDSIHCGDCIQTAPKQFVLRFHNHTELTINFTADAYELRFKDADGKVYLYDSNTKVPEHFIYWLKYFNENI